MGLEPGVVVTLCDVPLLLWLRRRTGQVYAEEELLEKRQKKKRFGHKLRPNYSDLCI